MKKFHYHNNCVGWPQGDVDCPGGLSDMINDAVDITRRTFLRHVDKRELSGIVKELGYAHNPAYGLTMAGDWHISYHRSKLHGKTVYFFSWSGIEYVFTQE